MSDEIKDALMYITGAVAVFAVLVLFIAHVGMDAAPCQIRSGGHLVSPECERPIISETRLTITR